MEEESKIDISTGIECYLSDGQEMQMVWSLHKKENEIWVREIGWP